MEVELKAGVDIVNPDSVPAREKHPTSTQIEDCAGKICVQSMSH